MKQNMLEFCDNLNDAIDRAVWLQFEHRNEGQEFVVYDGPTGNYAISDLQTANQMEMELHFYPLPDSYRNLSYKRLQAISKNLDMLKHWEDLLGKFMVMEGELLRFMLRYQIPLEKIIRHELSTRGFDENNRWVGFDASRKIWQGKHLEKS